MDATLKKLKHTTGLSVGKRNDGAFLGIYNNKEIRKTDDIPLLIATITDENYKNKFKLKQIKESLRKGDSLIITESNPNNIEAISKLCDDHSIKVSVVYSTENIDAEPDTGKYMYNPLLDKSREEQIELLMNIPEIIDNVGQDKYWLCLHREILKLAIKWIELNDKPITFANMQEVLTQPNVLYQKVKAYYDGKEKDFEMVVTLSTLSNIQEKIIMSEGARLAEVIAPLANIEPREDQNINIEDLYKSQQVVIIQPSHDEFTTAFCLTSAIEELSRNRCDLLSNSTSIHIMLEDISDMYIRYFKIFEDGIFGNVCCTVFGKDNAKATAKIASVKLFADSQVTKIETSTCEEYRADSFAE